MGALYQESKNTLMLLAFRFMRLSPASLFPNKKLSLPLSEQVVERRLLGPTTETSTGEVPPDQLEEKLAPVVGEEQN